jgi:hypothetical protein
MCVFETSKLKFGKLEKSRERKSRVGYFAATGAAAAAQVCRVVASVSVHHIKMGVSHVLASAQGSGTLLFQRRGKRPRHPQRIRHDTADSLALSAPG